jgi:collagen beta-1,O-galactosyltransferase
MQEIFRLIGLQFQRVDAVDGKALSPKQLEALKFMPGYLDPFHQRPMKTGEIGCFLSHLKVWEDIVRKGNQRSIVLEDDVRFTENGTIMFVSHGFHFNLIFKNSQNDGGPHENKV